MNINIWIVGLCALVLWPKHTLWLLGGALTLIGYASVIARWILGRIILPIIFVVIYNIVPIACIGGAVYVVYTYSWFALAKVIGGIMTLALFGSLMTSKELLDAMKVILTAAGIRPLNT